MFADMPAAFAWVSLMVVRAEQMPKTLAGRELMVVPRVTVVREVQKVNCLPPVSSVVIPVLLRSITPGNNAAFVWVSLMVVREEQL